MKNLLVNLKLLTFILFLFLLLPSCNNEELFVIEQSAIVAEETEPTEEEEEEEEDPNTEDVAPAIDVVDDTVFTMQHEPVDIEVHLNDINLPESIALSNTNPSNGILTINTNDTPDNIIDDIVVYTPNAGFSGVDAFDYTICDATNTDNCDTATVTITVEPIEEDIASELKAFPGAYGSGAYALGGRGGQIIHVTNLNDSGAGSFREAVETTGSRIIIFDVSGEINLSTRIWNDGYGDLTIAGQTAPEGGITITGKSVNIQTASNIVIRYIRFRNGTDGDGLALRGGSGNIMIDHCSFSWAKDEAIDVSANAAPATDKVTIQNCLFYQNKTAIIVGSNDEAASGAFSILRNAGSSTSHRFPKGAGDMDLDVINNLWHNWRYRTMRLDGFDFTLNHIGNYYQSGSNTMASAGNFSNGVLASGIYKISSNTTMSPTIYSRFNHIDKNLIDYYNDAYSNDPSTGYDMSSYSETNDFSAWSSFSSTNTNPVKSEWFTSTQQPLQGAEPIILLSSQLKNEILPKVGACQSLNADGTINFWRDSIDLTAVDEINNDSGEQIMTDSSPSKGVNPTYTLVSRPAGYDTDADGMPDIWETAAFGDLTRDGKSDLDGDGYTDLEEFLNLVDMN